MAEAGLNAPVVTWLEAGAWSLGKPSVHQSLARMRSHFREVRSESSMKHSICSRKRNGGSSRHHHNLVSREAVKRPPSRRGRTEFIVRCAVTSSPVHSNSLSARQPAATRSRFTGHLARRRRGGQRSVGLEIPACRHAGSAPSRCATFTTSRVSHEARQWPLFRFRLLCVPFLFAGFPGPRRSCNPAAVFLVYS